MDVRHYRGMSIFQFLMSFVSHEEVHGVSDFLDRISRHIHDHIPEVPEVPRGPVEPEDRIPVFRHFGVVRLPECFGVIEPVSAYLPAEAMVVEFGTQGLVCFRISGIRYHPVAEPGREEIHRVTVIPLHELRVAYCAVPLHVGEYVVREFPAPCREPEQGVPVQVPESYVEFAQVVESGNEFPAYGLAYDGPIYQYGNSAMHEQIVRRIDGVKPEARKKVDNLVHLPG